MPWRSNVKRVLLTDVREIFRRPTTDVLKHKESVLAHLRASRDRAERLARLNRYPEWQEFMDVLDQELDRIDGSLKNIHTRQFLNPIETEKRSLLIEQKGCYQKIRGMGQSASDSLSTLNDQITQNQAAVNEYRDRLGA